jgi:hypothetical protein
MTANPVAIRTGFVVSSPLVPAPADFADLYSRFQAPIAALDCGSKCAPYNERGVPFCCDTRHAVPTAYPAEWAYLQANTDLWHPFGSGPGEAGQAPAAARLQAQAPAGHALIACLGHTQCQRGFRSIVCRAFPFFPYLSRAGEFLGLSYYWEYEDRCWVISNLRAVSPEYRLEFILAYDWLFEHLPEERETFRHHSNVMRQIFGRKRRSIPLLHRNGQAYKVTPRNGRLRRVAVESLPKFGPYRLAAALPFPEEVEPPSRD